MRGNFKVGGVHRRSGDELREEMKMRRSGSMVEETR